MGLVLLPPNDTNQQLPARLTSSFLETPMLFYSNGRPVLLGERENNYTIIVRLENCNVTATGNS